MSAPVRGQVRRIAVKTGDRVNEGTLLAVLLSPDIADANAKLKKAALVRAARQRSVERAKQWLAQGVGSRLEYGRASSDLEVARAEEQVALALLTALGGSRDSDEYRLNSPIAGVVVERNAVVGREVDTDDDRALITVADLSTIWVITHIDEASLPLVHTGAEALVRVPIFPGRSWPGRITHIGDTIDQSTHSAVARIESPNYDSLLRPGMIATVDIGSSGDRR